MLHGGLSRHVDGLTVGASRYANAPFRFALGTQRLTPVWQHSVGVWFVNTAFLLPLTGRTWAADWVEVLGQRDIGTVLTALQGPLSVSLAVLTQHAPLVVQPGVFGWSGNTVSRRRWFCIRCRL